MNLSEQQFGDVLMIFVYLLAANILFLFSPDISGAYPADDNTVLLLNMEEPSWDGAPGEVIDSSGYGNHGMARNGATTTAIGRFGRAGLFDGNNDYVTVGTGQGLDMGTGDMTLEAWIKTTNTVEDWQGIITKWSCYPICHMSLYKGRLASRIGFNSSNNTVAISQAVVADGKWHHVAVVFDRDGNMTQYVDGVIVGARPISSLSSFDMTSPCNEVNIGAAGNGAAYFFRGAICGVRISNVARTNFPYANGNYHLTPLELSGFEASSGPYTWVEFEDSVSDSNREQFLLANITASKEFYCFENAGTGATFDSFFTVDEPGVKSIWVRYFIDWQDNKMPVILTDPLGQQIVNQTSSFSRVLSSTIDLPATGVLRYGYSWKKIWQGELLRTGAYKLTTHYAGVPVDCFVVTGDNSFVPQEAKCPGYDIAIIWGNSSFQTPANDLKTAILNSGFSGNINVVDQSRWQDVALNPFPYKAIITLGVGGVALDREADFLRMWLAKGGKLLLGGMQDNLSISLGGAIWEQYSARLDITPSSSGAPSILRPELPLLAGVSQMGNLSGPFIEPNHRLWIPLVGTTDKKITLWGRGDIDGTLLMTPCFNADIHRLVLNLISQTRPLCGIKHRIGAEVFPEYKIAALGAFDNSWNEFKDEIPGGDITFNTDPRFLPSRLSAGTPLTIHFPDSGQPLILRSFLIWDYDAYNLPSPKCGIRIMLNGKQIFRRNLPSIGKTVHTKKLKTLSTEVAAVLPSNLLSGTNILEIFADGTNPLRYDAIQLENYRLGNCMAFTFHIAEYPDHAGASVRFHDVLENEDFPAPDTFGPRMAVIDNFAIPSFEPELKTLLAYFAIGYNTHGTAPAWIHPYGIPVDGYEPYLLQMLDRTIAPFVTPESGFDKHPIIFPYPECSHSDLPPDTLVDRLRIMYEYARSKTENVKLSTYSLPNAYQSLTSILADFGMFEYGDIHNATLYGGKGLDLTIGYMQGLAFENGRHLKQFATTEFGPCSEGYFGGPAYDPVEARNVLKDALNCFLRMPVMDKLNSFLGKSNYYDPNLRPVWELAGIYAHVFGYNQKRIWMLAACDNADSEEIYYRAGIDDKNNIKVVICAENFSQARDVDISIPWESSQNIYFDVLVQLSDGSSITGKAEVVNNTISYRLSLNGDEPVRITLIPDYTITVARYHFADSSMGSQDVGPNSNDLFESGRSGPVIYQQDGMFESGSAVRFSNGCNYLRDADFSGLADGSPFTVSVWVKFNEFVYGNALQRIYHYVSSSGEFGFQLAIGPEQSLIFEIYNNGTWFGASTPGYVINTDEWINIVVTSDGSSTATIYINGENYSIYHPGQWLQMYDIAGLIVGGNCGYQSTMSGYMDEFAAYDIIMTPVQVNNIYLYQTALSCAKYHFADSSGAQDVSPNSNNLVEAGRSGPVLYQQDGMFESGSAVCFANGCNYLRDADFSGLADGSPFTVSVWVKFNEFVYGNALQRIYHYVSSSGEFGFQLAIGPEQSLVFEIYNNGAWFGASTPGYVINTDEWINIVVTSGGYETAAIYINGEDYSVYHTGQWLQMYDNSGLIVGGNCGYQSTMSGYMDELEIKQGEVSSEMVQMVYKNYVLYWNL